MPAQKAGIRVYRGYSWGLLHYEAVGGFAYGEQIYAGSEREARLRSVEIALSYLQAGGREYTGSLAVKAVDEDSTLLRGDGALGVNHGYHA